MSLWRQLVRGVRNLADPAASNQDAADEVQHYLEQTAAARIAAGLSRGEAHRAAQIEVGSVTAVREEIRSYGWENSVAALFADVRYAVRRLRHTPAFTAVCVLMLALGIGSNAAIFSVIRGVLLKPLPYAQPEQLVSLRHTAPGVNIKDLNMSPSLYYTYGDENRVFQSIGLSSTSTSTVNGIAEPEEVPVLMATNSLLPILKIQPALGRSFTAADEDPKSRSTVILSDGYWRLRFGGNLSALGRTLVIDGRPTEVIGVLPASFQFLDQKVSLLMPLQMDRAGVYLINFTYQGIARLKPGVTINQANADLTRMLPMAPAKFPPNPLFSANAFVEARIAPNLRFLKDDLVSDSGSTLWVLMATVGIILLIACANVANLTLVRAHGREQELAVRVALGAGSGRIARELLLESLLLSLSGGAIGISLAYEALRILAASELSPLPRVADISIDAWVILFTLCISVGSGVLFGLLPVFKYMRPQILSSIRSGGRSLSQGKERHEARNILVVLQVALALILLIGSGLMIRTFLLLRHVDPGFSEARNVQTIGISIPESQAKEPDRVVRTEEQILRTLAALAGVSSVAITNTVPMDGGSNDPVYAEHQPYRAGSVPPIRRYKYVSPGYVAAVGSRLVAGRQLTWAETYKQSPVAMVSENLAREWWHNPALALGKRIRPALRDDWFEVIGVLADLHDKGVDQNAPTIAYWPLMPRNFAGKRTRVQRSVAFVIRTPRAGSTSLLNEIRKAVWSVNPNLPVANVRTLQAVYEQSLARTSLTLILLTIAGGMALLLGVAGLYSVISYAVSQRTKEIGIRLALGAPLTEITGMFVRHGVALSAAGVVLGLAAALPLTHLMEAVLFNVRSTDPLTYAAVSGCLILAATLASYLSARRASKVDPIQALRAD